MNIVSEKQECPAAGSMSFTETILFFDKKPADAGIHDTIIFFNDDEKYYYQMSQNLCDYRSAVICFPNNFGHDDYDEGVVRVTFIANFEKWNELDRADYLLRKKTCANNLWPSLQNYFPVSMPDCFIPMFLPPEPSCVTPAISKALFTAAPRRSATGEPPSKIFSSAAPTRVSWESSAPC